jgi:hypothetical protein
MRQPKNAIIDSQLERGSPEERASGAASAGSLPLRWWRTMLGTLGAGRQGRYQATLKRLAQSDVADTVSEADVESWLKMLEVESAKQVPTAATSRLQSGE